MAAQDSDLQAQGQKLHFLGRLGAEGEDREFNDPAGSPVGKSPKLSLDPNSPYGGGQ